MFSCLVLKENEINSLKMEELVYKKTPDRLYKLDWGKKNELL